MCLVGCQHDPHIATFTTNQPNPDDLVGTYVPDPATAEFIARKGRYPQLPASITLGAGGALAITNIPDWWLAEFGKPGGGFDTGRGTWSVDQHQRWWAVGVHFQSTEQFASRQHRAESFGTSFMLVGELPPYKLHLTIGDPDEGRAMLFAREPSPLK